jgi:hypothetical protein
MERGYLLLSGSFGEPTWNLREEGKSPQEACVLRLATALDTEKVSEVVTLSLRSVVRSVFRSRAEKRSLKR